MKINKSSVKLFASPKAVINQFLHLPGSDRVKNIIERVKRLSDDDVKKLLDEVMRDFSARHRNIEEVFKQHFENINVPNEQDVLDFSHQQKLLIGAFFTKEYSIQAAALFNPSIVAHPDQHGLNPGQQRFVMSLRATGEGHISSIIFKTGIVDNASNIQFDKEPEYFTSLKKNDEVFYDKDFILKRIACFSYFNRAIIESLPQKFTAKECLQFIKNTFLRDESAKDSIKILEEIFDTNYELKASQLSINEKVIFPNAKAECMGMEDVRFVKFQDGDNSCYYGTYTAYDGHRIKSQLIETNDFNVFTIRTLYGDAISDKGMALFPEKVNGKYVMISRQGGEKMNIMYSDDLYVWNKYQILMEPQYDWELVQLGNCGSPIKTSEGWLLLTHGVGVMRTYVISAILLSLTDPSKIIARLCYPLLKADEEEREGYVPNVVYTCGLLRHGDNLIIPYAVSDAATGFATVGLNELLNEMKNN